jgi:superfamily I DNA/RNA helicase
MQWMVPRNRLGDAQVQILDRCLQLQQGRLWIQGFAGSGKTILLVHAIREALAANPNLTVCVVVYTHALKDLVSTGLPEHLGNIPVMTYFQFLGHPKPYDIIIVDEVQDLEERTLKALAQYAKKLIVAGDGDQSIYPERVNSSDIERILSPERHRLDILYRLTATLRDIVRTILPASHIEGARLARMATNVEVRLVHAPNIESEIAWVWSESCKYSRQGDPSAILLPKHKLIERFINHVCRAQNIPEPTYEKTERKGIDYDLVNGHLAKHGICLRYIGNDFGSLIESDERPLVYLMTYHSAKGLDYDTVFLPHLDDGIQFWRDDEALSRRLFFVATTRTRRNLFLSHHTQSPHEYVRGMPQHLLRKVEYTTQAAANNIDQEIF